MWCCYDFEEEHVHASCVPIELLTTDCDFGNLGQAKRGIPTRTTRHLLTRQHGNLVGDLGGWVRTDLSLMGRSGFRLSPLRALAGLFRRDEEAGPNRAHLRRRVPRSHLRCRHGETKKKFFCRAQ